MASAFTPTGQSDIDNYLANIDTTNWSPLQIQNYQAYVGTVQAMAKTGAFNVPAGKDLFYHMLDSGKANSQSSEKSALGSAAALNDQYDPLKQAVGANVTNIANRAAPQYENYTLQAPNQIGSTNIAPLANSTGTAINTTNDAQARQLQLSNIGNLSAAAAGQGPSVAAQQAKDASDRASANMVGLLASQRGASNNALNLRLAAQNYAGNQQGAANNAINGRLAEQQAAQSALVGATSGLRGADDSLAASQANLTQNNNQFNAGAGNTRSLAQAQLDAQRAAANTSIGNTAKAAQDSLNVQTQRDNVNMKNAQAQYADAAKTAGIGQTADLANRQQNNLVQIGGIEAGQDTVAAQLRAQTDANDKAQQAGYISAIGSAIPVVGGAISSLGKASAANAADAQATKDFNAQNADDPTENYDSENYNYTASS